MKRQIGQTGVHVHPVGWGPMPLSTRSERPDRESALEVFKAALDAGIEFIDTANAYCLDDTETGHNERLIGWALKELGAENQVHVTSKSGMIRPNGAWVKNGRPEHLRAACEQSLRDLGVETIWLYQLHWPDPAVPYADSVGALADLQREGKIQHVGISNASSAHLREAQGIVRVESVQNPCSPTRQGDFSEGVIGLCAEQNVTYTPYGPVGGSGGYKKMGVHPLLTGIGEANGISAYQTALAWLLSKGAHIVPIPGGSRATSVRDSAAAATVKLSAGELSRIDALG